MLDSAPPPPRQGFSLRRLLPLAVIVIGLALFLALGLDRYLSFATLSQYREELTQWVAAHRLLAVLAYIALYTVVIALSLPGGAVMTITGGFLFGIGFGTLWTVIGATLGATALFLAARTALGEPLRARAGPWLKRMEAGFRENAFNYLLVLRLIPIFPFWLVNLVPAFLGVPLSTYVLATGLGIIPGSFVYASVGNGLGAILERGETPDLGLIFNPEILIPLVGLALLALLPVAYRKLRNRPPQEGIDHG
ncbi:MAG: TVP38/TMEM64 family protein [Candidatus Competibacteraceae bacterium]|nr:TVP38/TMEM64 family protein [Candidatus Competibacteraceae bacterium]